MSERDDFAELDDLDDLEFLAARRRVRDALDATPALPADPELTARYQAMNDEFCRRARLSWGAGQ